MSKFKDYLSLVKFSHTIFAMPFAMIGFFLGVMQTNFFVKDESVSPMPGLHFNRELINITTSQFLVKFLLVLVCMVTARSAAMAFNRYLDRSFDAKKPTHRHSRNTKGYYCSR